MSEQSRRRRKRLGADYAPIVWGSLATLAVLALFPTVLRPPPDEAQSSAEFSPDAPPDEDPDVIVQTLEQARSQTAGGLRQPFVGDGVDATTTTTTRPAAQIITKSQCFGNPPRQVESHYSAPCKGIFTGVNGGATSAGVTADEIRIGFMACTDNFTQDTKGPMPADDPGGNGGTSDPVWWAYRKYFNDHFVTYNRYIQFYGAQPDCQDEQTRHASTIALDQQYEFFAVLTDKSDVAKAMAERGKLVFFTWEEDADVYDEYRPFMWNFDMTGQQRADHSAEYLCKRLAGRPAIHAGDTAFQTQTRKFGVFLQDYTSRTGYSGWQTLEQKIRDRCGEEVIVFAGEGYDPALLSQMMAQFRLEGVTTVAVRTDPVSNSLVLKAASSQGYRPEWFILPTKESDHPGLPKLFAYEADQWSNTFGLGQREPNRRSIEYDWGKAYRYAYPTAQSAPVSGSRSFDSLLQLVNGIHQAGPDLNPNTLAEGLYAMGQRFWDNGDVGGGFSPTDSTYMDDLMEIWWDPTAEDYLDDGSGTSNAPGAFVHLPCGKRYVLGTYPDTEPTVFDRTVSCRTGSI